MKIHIQYEPGIVISEPWTYNISQIAIEMKVDLTFKECREIDLQLGKIKKYLNCRCRKKNHNERRDESNHRHRDDDHDFTH